MSDEDEMPTVIRTHRATGSLLIVAVALIALVGCAAPKDVKHEAKSHAGMNCATYSHLDSAHRATAASAAGTPTDFVEYTATDATVLTAAQYLDELCAKGNAGDSVADTIANLQDSYPSCADYLKLDAATQLKWATAVADAVSLNTPQLADRTRALTAGCVTSAADLDAPTLMDSSREIILFLMNNPSPAAFEAYLEGHAVAPAAPSTAPFAGTANVTSTDGYTFTVQYNFSLGGQFATSTTKEKPGFSSITAKPSAAITVTNTTAGRQLSFNVVGFGTSPGGHFAGMFQIAGIFPDGSPVCALVAAGYGPTPPTASALQWHPSAGCAYVYENAPVGPDGSNTATLSVGGSRSLSAFGSVGDATTYSDEYASNVRSSSGPMIVAHVSDADYPAVLAALSAPPKLVLALAGGSLVEPALNCQVIATSDGSAGC
jgi:hypothetical protein